MKASEARDEMVKDVNGQILRDGVEVGRRWAEYFEQAPNVADGNWRNSWLLADADVKRFE